MLPKTADHMTWHQSYDAVEGVMMHPSDDEAWKHFNSVHPHFSAEQGTCVLGYVQTDLTHSGHLLLLILVGRSYSQFLTCHQECL